ncbi:MAG TPA: TonB family protein [Verrucomicrobiae bacterium]|nr:TonB family protein [Verrucomicrobiae bacterium]
MIESAARVERITTDSTPRSAYHWEVPQKPVAVNLPYEMVDRLEHLVVDSFRSLTSRGSEIGGVLIGRTSAGSPLVVAVEEFELVSCDYSRGPLYRLSDADMARFERAIEQRSSGPTRVVGYFRSHTRKGLALDPEDVAFLDSHFRDPHHIALLVRPYASKASTAGIFIRENGVYRPEASYLEFPFRATELTANAPVPVAGPAVVEEPPASQPPAAPALPSTPKPPMRAQIVPIASRREVAPPEAPPAPTPAASVSLPVESPAKKLVPEPAPRPEDKTLRKDDKFAPKDDKSAHKDDIWPAVKLESKPEVKPAPESKIAVDVKPSPLAPPAAAKPLLNKEAAAKESVLKDSAAKNGAPKDAAVKDAPVKPGALKDSAVKETPKSGSAAAVKDAAVKDAPVKPTAPAKDAPLKAAAVKDAAVKDVARSPFETAMADAGETPRRGKGMMIGIAALLLAAAGAGAYFMIPGLHKSGRIPATSGDTSQLNLRVEHSGADLLLTWNRDAAVVKGAAHAVLSIYDGDRQDKYDMDPGQLANGSIEYQPITQDVSFRMEVTGTDHSKVASESVRVLRTRPSPMPDDPKGKNASATTATTPDKKNDSTSAGAATPTASTDDAAPEKDKLISPTRKFDSASLSQPLTSRLRPTTSSDLPDAPTVGGAAAPQANLGAPNLGSMAPAPVAPRAPAPPTPTPAQTPAPTPKTGGQITQAQLLVHKDPEYPKIAQQMGVRGTVELLATIGTDGHVKTVKVLSGHEMLAKAAREAVMQWIYKPTLLNGIPVENETHIKIDFASSR